MNNPIYGIWLGVRTGWKKQGGSVFHTDNFGVAYAEYMSRAGREGWNDQRIQIFGSRGEPVDVPPDSFPKTNNYGGAWSGKKGW